MIEVIAGNLTFNEKTYQSIFQVTSTYPHAVAKGTVEVRWNPSWEGDGIETTYTCSKELRECLQKMENDSNWTKEFSTRIQALIQEVKETQILQREVSVLQQLKQEISFHHVEWVENSQQICFYFSVKDEKSLLCIAYDYEYPDSYTCVHYVETENDWDNDPALCTEDLLFDLFVEHIDTIPQLRLPHLFQPLQRPEHELYQKIKEKLLTIE